jgi:hypothetical protein
MQEIELVLADGFQIEMLGTGPIKFRILGDVMEVTSLCGGREAAQLHVFDEPLT